MKGSKGVLSGLKELEESHKIGSRENEKRINTTRKIRKSFLIEEYYENLLKVIKFQRGLSQTDILKAALEDYASEDEKVQAKNKIK